MHKDIYMPEQRVQKEEINKNRILERSNFSSDMLQFAIQYIKAFLQMLMLKTSLLKDQTLISH